MHDPQTTNQIKLMILQQYQKLLNHREQCELSRAEIYEEYPVGIQEFLNSPLYCPAANQVRPVIKKMLIDIFDGGYFEALIIAGIGAGKSFLTSKALEYLTYQLLCLKNPQRFYNLADDSSVYLVNVSTNKDQAKKVVFGEVKNRIDQNPWFRQFHPPSNDIKSELRFDKNISIFPLGSNEAAPLGFNIFAGVIDEASFHIRTKNKDYAEASHNQMTKRIKSRFFNKGRMFTITSPRFVYDFAEKKFDSDKSPSLYKKRLAIWDAIPKRQFCGKIFDLGQFFPEHIGKKVPTEYYDDFKKNPDLAMRDLGAVPSLAVQAFFKDAGVILRHANKKRLDPVKPDGKVANWLKAKDSEARFVHLDLALGKETGDVAGLAMGKFDGWVEYKNPENNRMERRPKIFIDLMHAFAAKPGKEIEFAQIREFIYELKSRGFNIRKISADSWQSKDTLQILKNKGFQTMTLSVDKNIEAYTYLKEALLEKRINYYVHPIFIRECRYLELLEGKKVDHPMGMSKDVADAVAGVSWHCNKSVGGLGVVIAGNAEGNRAPDEVNFAN